jgi:hypothetical protein
VWGERFAIVWGVELIERATGPWILMASAGWGDATTNQKLVETMEYIWGDNAQGDDDRGVCCRIVWAFKLLDKNQ